MRIFERIPFRPAWFADFGVARWMDRMNGEYSRIRSSSPCSRSFNGNIYMSVYTQMAWMTRTGQGHHMDGASTSRRI